MDNNNSNNYNTNQNSFTSASSGPVISEGAQLVEASTASQQVRNLEYSLVFTIEKSIEFWRKGKGPIDPNNPFSRLQTIRKNGNGGLTKDMLILDSYECEVFGSYEYYGPNDTDELKKALSWCVNYFNYYPGNLSYQEFLLVFNFISTRFYSGEPLPVLDSSITKHSLVNLKTLVIDKFSLDSTSFQSIQKLPLTFIDLRDCEFGSDKPFNLDFSNTGFKSEEDKPFNLDFSNMKFLMKIHVTTSRNSKPITILPRNEACMEIKVGFFARSTLMGSYINCKGCKVFKKLEVDLANEIFLNGSISSSTELGTERRLRCNLPDLPTIEYIEWTVPSNLSSCVAPDYWWSNLKEARLISKDFKVECYDIGNPFSRNNICVLTEVVKPESGTALLIRTPDEFGRDSFVRLQSEQ